MAARFDREAAKRLRLAADLKPEIVALATGRTTGAVFAWERGPMQPRMEVMVRLTKLYGCQLNDLLVQDDDDEAWMDAVRAACVATRRAQGLPDQIEDEDAIADGIALLSRSRK